MPRFGSRDEQPSDAERREALRLGVEARAAREAEQHRRHRDETRRATERFPRWEYKVLTSTALAGWGGGRIEDLEPMLNHHAAQGWRVVSISFTGQISQALATDKNHLYVVLERPALDGGHVGHPVERA